MQLHFFCDLGLQPFNFNHFYIFYSADVWKEFLRCGSIGIQSIQPSPIQFHRRCVLPPILPSQSYLDSNPQTNKENIVIQSVAEINTQKSLNPTVSPSRSLVTPTSSNCVSDISIVVPSNSNEQKNVFHRYVTFYNTLCPPVPSNTPKKSIELPTQIQPLNLLSPSPPISFQNTHPVTPISDVSIEILPQKIQPKNIGYVSGILTPKVPTNTPTKTNELLT